MTRDAESIPDAEGAADDSSARRVMFTNAAWMLTGQAVGKAASFAFVVVVTRRLDSASYGYFNFAVSYVPLFLIVGTWGLNVALIREIAADRKRFSELMASGLVIRALLGGAAVVLSLVMGSLLVSPGAAYTTLAVVAVALLLDEVTNLIGSAFKAVERMGFFSAAFMVNRIVTALLALVAVERGGGIVAVSAMYLLGSATALVVAVLLLRRSFPPVRSADVGRSTLRFLFIHGAPLGVAAALNMALFRVDTVMLQAMVGATAVAYYGVAYRFLDSFLFVAYGLAVVAMPRIARSSWSREAEDGFNAVLTAMLAFYLPVAVGGFFLAPWAVTFVFSERYAPAAGSAKWLAGAALFYAVAYLCRVSAVALGRRRPIAVVAALALTFNVSANLLVIPRYGFEGAAAVTFASEVLEASALAVVLRRAAGRIRLSRSLLAPAVAVLAMAAVLSVSDRAVVGFVFGGAIYAGALVVAMATSADLRSSVRRLRTRAPLPVAE